MTVLTVLTVQTTRAHCSSAYVDVQPAAIVIASNRGNMIHVVFFMTLPQ